MGYCHSISTVHQGQIIGISCSEQTMSEVQSVNVMSVRVLIVMHVGDLLAVCIIFMAHLYCSGDKDSCCNEV